MSWEYKNLSEVCAIAIGKTPSRSNKNYWDVEKKTNNVWLSIADISSAKSKTISNSKEYVSDLGASLFKPVVKGTLLMSFKLSLGKLAYAGADLRTNEAIVALPIKNNKQLLSEFLYYYLSFYDWDKEAGNDIKVKGKTLNKEKLKNIKVPLPPLPTQQKIVAKLDAIFAEIDKATAANEANVKNAEALFQSYLTEVFERGGEGWNENNLGHLCELYQPQTITTKDLIADGKYPVYGANGVIGRYDKFNHVEAQLLVTCRGATCGAVNVTAPYAWINGNAMVVKPKIDGINIRFVEYFFRGAVDLTKAITGTAQPQITRQSLSPVKFKYPSLEVQTKLVEKLDIAFEAQFNSIETYAKKLTELSLLKQSILQQAFNGELVKE